METSSPGMILDVFIAGKLRNPLNGSWGSWRKHARLAKDWRERTAQHILVARAFRKLSAAELQEPKRVTFTAYVGAQWDDDSIPGAIKPARDALVGVLIHSDAPSSGHEFVYRQVIRREQRGVQISVTPLIFFGRSQGNTTTGALNVPRGTHPGG